MDQKAKTFSYYYRGFAILGVFLFALTFAVEAHAKKNSKKNKIPKSTWALATTVNDPNSSFLNLSEGGYENFKKRDIHEKILDRQSTLSQRQAYEDMIRNYELRKQYGLTSQAEEQAQIQRNSSFSKGVVRNVFDFQLEQGLKKAEKNSDEGRTFRKVQQGVNEVVQASGSVSVNNDVKFGTRTNLRDQQGALYMESSLLNMTLDANMSDKIKVGGFASLLKKESSKPEDHYRLMANRQLPVLGLFTGVSYGFESTKMRASISKEILKNVTAEVSQNRGLDAGRSNNTQREEVLTVNYGINF